VKHKRKELKSRNTMFTNNNLYKTCFHIPLKYKHLVIKILSTYGRWNVNKTVTVVTG